MKIENVEVFGFASAFRAMRNPMDSWHKADSVFESKNYDMFGSPIGHGPWVNHGIKAIEAPAIGREDMRLALKLIKAGPVHRKFLRQIIVAWDLTLPRMIWTEWDTYKVGVVRNSCSTMHKLGSRDLGPEDFEGYEEELDRPQLDFVNRLAAEHRMDGSAESLHRLKLRLPESYLQRATCTFSYEVAMRMHDDRKGHRMPEWSGDRGICWWIERLPYMDLFLGAVEEEDRHEQG